MARRGHKEQNHQREESKRLEWHTRYRTGQRTRHEYAQDWIRIAAGVVGRDDERGVSKSKEKTRYARVTTIIEQGQEARIQPAQWSNTKNDVQQQESTCPKCADEHDLISDAWK